MNNVLKVIWFDDEYQVRKKIRESAHLKGIKLVGFDNAEDGIKELEQNIEAYDAALLDGIFYETSSEKGLPTEDDAMGKVAKKLLQLENRKKLPWFILSGQDSFTKESNRFADSFKEGKVYDKLGGDEEYEHLWSKLIDEASKLVDTQLKYKYRELLLVCTDDFLGPDMFSRLFIIIKHIENVERLKNAEDMLVPLRKVMERMFSKMSYIGIIPEEIIKNKGWINKSSLFLSGMHSDYEHLTEIVHPTICENIHRLLNIIQDGSHSEGGLKLRVDEYLKTSKSDYLYRSCAYLLFDVLIWYKNYIIENNKTDKNKAKWELKENRYIDNSNWISGEVIRIADNGYGTFKPDDGSSTISIIPKMVKDNKLKEGSIVNVITEQIKGESKRHIKEIKITT